MENPPRIENTLAQVWRKTFAQWPADFRRKGVVVPTFGEAIAFVDFVLNEDMVVLERPTPDTAGARRVAVPFLLIEALKYTEPLKSEQFLSNGFAQKLASPASSKQFAESAKSNSLAAAAPGDAATRTNAPLLPQR